MGGGERARQVEKARLVSERDGVVLYAHPSTGAKYGTTDSWGEPVSDPSGTCGRAASSGCREAKGTPGLPLGPRLPRGRPFCWLQIIEVGIAWRLVVRRHGTVRRR